MTKTMVRQAVPLHPMEVHGGAGIHLQPMEDPMLEQPVPMLDNPFSKEIFLNTQSKPPLVQLEAISSRLITCYLGPTLLQLPFRLVLQTLHQLHCPSLDTLQHLNVSLVVRGPKLNTGFEVRPHQCRVQGHDHFPSPAGHTISDTSQGAVGLLGHLGTLPPIPMLDNPFSKEIVPNSQSKPPLVQLEVISSCSIACYLGEETDTHLSTTSFQVVVESGKVSPQPPFLQAKQPQFPQLLLIRLVLQTLHQLRCPSLDLLQHLNVSLVLTGPKLNTGFEVRPHQCRVQGDDRFPSPAGHTISDTSQDAIGFLGHLGTLLAHIQAAVDQHSQVLFCQAAFQPLFPKPAALYGVVVTQVQDLALGLVESHTLGLSPLIQPSLPTLKQINTPTQLGVICNLTEGALDPLVQIIDKYIEQNWPQHRALGNTTCDWLPTGFNFIHHNTLGPSIQPVLYPVKNTPVQAMSSQFLQENVVQNGVEGFTKIQVDNIHSLSLIH
ncbi:hypothetical protein QYF61_012849 [Mycteria americana]|uniref:Uncharacterized protein n=1 Tax=Mycteria americana TaxID=33587 RepID=A0AAN7PHC4_MYCAM|nr:hypothetical protein QYF61_012849 [Mycteria americana]